MRKDTEITVTYSKDDSQWFTVEYKVNGNGSIKDGETSKYEDVLKGTAWNSTKAPETVAEVGYKFNGWDKNPEKITENTVITGTFVKDDSQWFTVEYKVNGNGSIKDGETSKYEDVLKGTAWNSTKAPETVAEVGYKFNGWDKNPEKITENTVITGTFVKDDSQWFTVEYKVNGNGSIKDGETSKYEGCPQGHRLNSTKAPETVAEVGYKFNGWDKNPEKITENTVITGTFVKDDSQWFTVTFNSNGGSTVASQTVKYNDKAKEPTAPTKSGYTFAGWYTEEQLTTKYVFDTPVTGNITLYAKWNTNYVPYYPPVPPTVKIEDDDALGLNTTDHFAYIIGYGNGEVRPQNNITRAEVATIFFRLLTDDVRDENLTKTNRYPTWPPPSGTTPRLDPQLHGHHHGLPRRHVPPERRHHPR
ncbi:MAG: InlB B-repeat-containing protein [Oscillibacter sp.]